MSPPRSVGRTRGLHHFVDRTALCNGKLSSERSNEFWSEEEEKRLERDFRDGLSISELCLNLKRSENAVVQRLQSTGLLTPPSNKYRHKAKKPKYPAPAVWKMPAPSTTERTEPVMFENYDDMMTVDEVSEALRIGKNALYELLLNKKLRGYRNGRVWRIPKESVIAFIRGEVSQT